MYIFILPLIIVALLTLPVVYRIKTAGGSAEKTRNALIANICTFFGVLLLAVVLPIGNFVSAEETDAAAKAVSSVGLGYLGAALAVGLGSIGCGIAVGSAAPAAIGAVSEEPKSFGKALIFVALGEGVALYGFLIAFMIINKL